MSEGNEGAYRGGCTRDGRRRKRGNIFLQVCRNVTGTIRFAATLRYGAVGFNEGSPSCCEDISPSVAIMVEWRGCKNDIGGHWKERK